MHDNSAVIERDPLAFAPTDDGQKLNYDIAETVAAELDLHKARDIDIIDVGGKTVITDYFVIASASSTTAVKALCGDGVFCSGSSLPAQRAA